MKLISKKELKTLEDVADFIQGYVEYYEDVESDEDSIIPEITKTLSALKKIINKEDYKPKIRTKEIVKEVKIDVSDGEKIMIERKAMEKVDPLFKYCIINHGHVTMWLTDDYGKALGKAKEISMLEENRFFGTIYKIKKVKDGTYKLFSDLTYNQGEIFEKSNEEFLHFDYVRRICSNVIKL